MTEALEIELGLGVDMADIFEVRGYPRTARGTLCPIEIEDDRVAVRLRRARRPAADDDRHRRRGAHRAGSTRSRRVAGRERRRAAGVRVSARRPAHGRVDRRRTRARRQATEPEGDRTCASAAARRDRRPRRRTRLRVRGPAGRVRPRAARSDAQPLDRRPRGAAQRRPRGRRALPRRGDPVVRDAVRARQHHRRARDGRVHPVAARSRRSTSWPASRPRPTTRGTTPSRARSSTSCGPARWRGPARRRTTRTTAASIRRRCG